MYALGYDIGSSSIKCAIIDCDKGVLVARGAHPPVEMAISSPRPGWAEQNPEQWWDFAKLLTQKLLRDTRIDAAAIAAIGISYQMHGLVLVDRAQQVLRPAIIWCDSRAVEIGNQAFKQIGPEKALQHLLNSPGNFTASKLRWVQEHEPDIYKKIHKAMLPGDFIAMKLCGEIATTVSGLSEGIFWDFQQGRLSEELLSVYGIDPDLLAPAVPTFAVQGQIDPLVARELGLSDRVVVSYRAGDQPNNAFSLNVLNPGEIAATAGTSGVVYGVIDQVRHDRDSRVNLFAHVNHSETQTRLGVLLCINGTGILNAWMRKNFGAGLSYDEMNELAAGVAAGAEGISVLPFGNGAERVLQNANIGSHLLGIDFNRHSRAHLFRAAQEGIAFSFAYGIDIMKEMGLHISAIRAGKTNLFLSPIFRETLANLTGATIELYDTDGAAGAARGAALGAGYYASFAQAFTHLRVLETIHPRRELIEATAAAYRCWQGHLQRALQQP